LNYWESVFQVKMEAVQAGRSYDLNLEANTYDLVFCYAAAHHFVEYKKTLKQLKKLLRKGGKIIFLYEPTSSRLFYPLYYKYVNTAAHSTPEDVLIPSQFRAIAAEVDLTLEVHYDPHQTIQRSSVISTYFKILKTFKFLQPVLPASADLVFTMR